MKIPLIFCAMLLLANAAHAQSFQEDFSRGKPADWTISASENTVWVANDSLGVGGSTCMVADYGSNSNMAFSILSTSTSKIDEMTEPTLYMTVATVNNNFIAPNLVLLFRNENEWVKLQSWGGHSADSALIIGQDFSGKLQKKNVFWHKLSFSLDSLKRKNEIQLGFKADFINGGWILLDNVSLEEKRPVSTSELPITFTVFPNPVISTLHVNHEQGVLQRITLYNSLGAQLNSPQVHSNISSHQVDMSAQPNGVYYVSFELTTGAIVTKKILKQ